jgi:hypothetical protein
MMGLASVTGTTTGVDGIVRFTAGEHRSLIDPSASPAATLEMQREIAGFLSSGGTVIPITDPSIIVQ